MIAMEFHEPPRAALEDRLAPDAQDRQGAFPAACHRAAALEARRPHAGRRARHGRDQNPAAADHRREGDQPFRQRLRRNARRLPPVSRSHRRAGGQHGARVVEPQDSAASRRLRRRTRSDSRRRQRAAFRMASRQSTPLRRRSMETVTASRKIPRLPATAATARTAAMPKFPPPPVIPRGTATGDGTVTGKPGFRNCRSCIAARWRRDCRPAPGCSNRLGPPPPDTPPGTGRGP